MIEYLDLVDENNQIRGVETRAKIHCDGLWHRGVHVLVFNLEGCLTLQVRSSSKDKFPNCYDCSVSEHLKSGETYEAAAIRGLKEELGISGVKLEKLLRFRMSYGLNDNMISEVYKCNYDGAVKIDRREVQGLTGFSLSEIEALLVIDGDKFAFWTGEILKWYLKTPSKVEILSVE